MQAHSLAIPYVIVALSLVAGCGRDAAPNHQASLKPTATAAQEKLILYSVDGRDFEPGQEPKTEEKFHGFPVLGKVEIKDAVKQKEILNAVQDGIAQSDGKMARCFWPRHGLRVQEDGKDVDYVLCFECYQLRVHRGGDVKTEPIIRAPQAVLNKYLQEAGVPLAPGMVDK